AVSDRQINVSWTASTDNVGVTNYLVERLNPGTANFVQIGTTTGTTFTDTGLSAATSYSYRVRATDAAANLSPYSNTASATTTAPDTTPPTVALTAPAAGALVTGTILLSATATDNVGVVGVQFLLDNASLGTEVTSTPYTFSWDTSSVGSGTHTLSAR